MKLTNHIKTRYTERIAGRDTTLDINTYLAQNEEKIEKDILTMIDHSEVIFSGQTSSDKDPVKVRLSGSWVIITDEAEETAITLYKVDFGLGEQFNKLYISNWLEKLRGDLAILNEKKAEAGEDISAYKKAIKSNEGLISEYESLIKSLKTDIKSYQDIITNKKAEWSNYEIAVRRDIEALTKRREF